MLMLIVIVNYCFRGAGTFVYLVFLSHPFVLCYIFSFLLFVLHPRLRIRECSLRSVKIKNGTISLLYIYCRMFSDAAP